MGIFQDLTVVIKGDATPLKRSLKTAEKDVSRFTKALELEHLTPAMQKAVSDKLTSMNQAWNKQLKTSKSKINELGISLFVLNLQLRKFANTIKSFYKSAFESYVDLMGANTKLGLGITRLRVKWEIFKIRTINILSPLFEKIIGWIEDIFDWWDDLPNSTKKWYSKLLLVGGALIILASRVAEILTGVIAFAKIIGVVVSGGSITTALGGVSAGGGIAGISTAFGEVGTAIVGAIGGLSGFLTGIGLIIAALITVYGMWKAISELSPEVPEPTYDETYVPDTNEEWNQMIEDDYGIDLPDEEDYESVEDYADRIDRMNDTNPLGLELDKLIVPGEEAFPTPAALTPGEAQDALSDINQSFEDMHSDMKTAEELRNEAYSEAKSQSKTVNNTNNITVDFSSDNVTLDNIEEISRELSNNIAKELNMSVS
ncbi:MAG: hypothetical protein ABEK36_04400 [Candidatus Aenigmatarchaeota archaeon]